MLRPGSDLKRAEVRSGFQIGNGHAARRIILALDQGTSSSRALLFDERAELLGSHNETFSCHFPEPGWVEVDPQLLWETQLKAIREVLRKAGVMPSQVHALGLSNQRETILAWQSSTGTPVGPAIVWQCRRSEPICARLRAQGCESEVRARTGLCLDAYFSASKMAWILEHNARARTLAQHGDLAFGTVDSWLIWQLTLGSKHLTDASNASRTLLYNLERGDWDSQMLQMFGIPRACLPEICDSSGVVAHTAKSVLGAEIPIAGIAGDQQAALFGQACFAKGMAKNTYGTGCFTLVNSGKTRVHSQHGLLSTVAWRLAGVSTFALEGSVFVAGALMQWLRDELGLVRDVAESSALAESVPDNGGVYIVPAFVGLGAPHWQADARGLITGLTRGSTRAHLVRAALESVAYQVFDLMQAIRSDFPDLTSELRVDGGMSANHFLCQFQADVLSVEICRPKSRESSALGAAMLAGLGAGVWHSLGELEALWQAERSFLPQPLKPRPDMSGWRHALAQAMLAPQ